MATDFLNSVQKSEGKISLWAGTPSNYLFWERRLACLSGAEQLHPSQLGLEDWRYPFTQEQGSHRLQVLASHPSFQAALLLLPSQEVKWSTVGSNVSAGHFSAQSPPHRRLHRHHLQLSSRWSQSVSDTLPPPNQSQRNKDDIGGCFS